MFAYLKGSIEGIYDRFIVIDVNGVGYKIFTSISTIQKLQLHSEVKIYTYMHVREDIINIFGFATEEELNTFELLITVSGVGPKAGLAVLDVLSPEKLALAINQSDHKLISKAQGVGKKTAQRIILELKDKIEAVVSGNMEELDNTQNNSLNDAINALTALGYSTFEANRAVKKVQKEEMSVEEIIKLALKELMK